VQPFKTVGKWWLPESPEKQVYGTLSCSESGELELSLLGTLSGTWMGVGEKEFPVILGVADDEKSGQEVRSSSSFGGKETIFTHRGYFGLHAEEPDSLRFSKANLTLSGLANWAESITGFDKGRPAFEFTVSWKHPGFVGGDISGGTVALGVGCTLSGQRERRLSERVGFVLAFDPPVNAQRIEAEFVSPFQNFLTFATDHANSVSELSLTPVTAFDSAKVIGAATFWDDSLAADLREWVMLFTYGDIQERFSNVCQSWLELSKVQHAAFSVYFGSLYRPPSYTDLRVSLLAQVLSLYSAGRLKTGSAPSTPMSGLDPETQRLLNTHPVVSTERALTALTAEFEDHFAPLVEDRPKRLGSFIEYATNTVRYTLTRTPPAAPYAGDGADLYWLGDRLAFLFKMAVLADLGFSHAEIGRLLARNRTYLHIRDTLRSKRQL
jgi:hypothetical protein